MRAEDELAQIWDEGEQKRTFAETSASKPVGKEILPLYSVQI